MTTHPAETEQDLRRALQNTPDDALIHARLALLLERQKRPGEAEQHHRRAVALDDANVELRLNLANFLAASDSDEDVAEAKTLFIEIIRANPAHFQAWNNLGNLLFETGYTSAAHTAYSAAATYHPGEASAHVNLGNVLLYKNDLAAAQTHFRNALELDSGLAEAHQGLASILHRQNDEAQAAYHRAQGFGNKAVTTLAYRGRDKPAPLLILASALEGNIPWRFLIDQSVFETTIVAVEYFDHSLDLTSLPLIFNAIGDADLSREGLEIARQMVAGTGANVINAPDAVLQTGRLANARRLALLQGVTVPRMESLCKAQLRSGAALQTLAEKRIGFPLLLRAPGFHGGNHFVRADSAEELPAAVDTLPGETVLAMEFLDPRCGDALFRKYRVMAINGALYPVHMAISAHWKVHYFSSNMAENSRYRDEEAAFLHDFSAVLGPEVMTALARISHAMGLDYCGMDFSVADDGRLLLYEANATMAIVPPSHETQWDYRRRTIERALAAAKNMFTQRISQQT